jgi:F-type H+-transporting ATPase subunit gamma
MANLRDIRTRISSTKSTQQITKAMKMVSAARLRRAQHNITNLRPYAKQLLSVIADVAITHRVHHPLLSVSADPKNILVLVLTSDRGLAGGFNANINRFALKWYNTNKPKYAKVDLFFIGRKVSDFFKTRRIEGIQTVLHLAREISFPMAAKIADKVMEDFSTGGYDAIYVIYNEFKSALSQEVICEQILPVDLSKTKLAYQEKAAAHGSSIPVAKDLIFEPPPAEMVDQLLRRHFAVQIYRVMSESVAGEHGARMTAMENATKNAGEMISNLTLTYNKLRQASITTELIEITSGAEALKG